MSDSMIERVAMAILDCEAAGPISGSAARVVARAAIEAMREPTLAMAGMGDRCSDPLDPRAVWRAMIDAALESK